MKSTQLCPQQIARIRSLLAKYDIPHRAVAEEAGVSKFMISHVLAGRAKSARVIAVMKRLIVEARESRKAERERAA